MALVPVLTVTTTGQGQVPERPSLFSRSNWVQLDMVFGRLTVVGLHSRQTRSRSDSDPASGVRETLSVSAGRGPVSLHYQFEDAERRMTVVLMEGSRWEIEQEPQGPSPQPRVCFYQPAEGPVTLEVDQQAKLQHYSAASLWHLLLAEPEVCRQHLVPILQWLRPGWQLVETAGQVEASLFRRADSGWRPDRKQLAELVEQLGAPQFQQRQQADRQLRRMGPVVLPYLSQLDRRQLDAEQRLRLRSICQALTAPVADTPERVAAWLVDDPAVWLTYASHHDPFKQQVAAQYLLQIR